MKKLFRLQTIFWAIVLTACGNGEDKPTTHKDNVVAEVPVNIKKEIPLGLTQDEIVEKLIALSPNDNAAMLEYAELLYNTSGNVAARGVSNSLWAGSNGFERNRRASGAIAVAVYNESQQGWSTLRAGIAYVNGLGVDADAPSAIRILSDEVLFENSAAQFFLAKAYELDGQNDAALLQLRKAADMGHSRAKLELQGR